MRSFLARLWNRLPLQFRVLHHQFLLRVIDLEALSIEADIPRYLGQFAGILIMFSIIHGLGMLWFPPPPLEAWRLEQSRISDMLLVVGLCSVLTWDNTFPDRRDVMVLGPLPVLPRTILLAKLTASGTLLGIALLALNCASSVGYSIVLGAPHGGVVGIARFLAAHWFTMVCAATFLYGAVLTFQGFAALLLSRRMFLRLSALAQLTGFALFLCLRFLQPVLKTHADLIDPANHRLLATSPTFWFLALFNQMNGSLPSDLLWLAHRAWFALAVVATGAGASLLLCYLRTMKKTVEEPDLVPGAGGLRWFPRIGGSLQTAIVLFCLRSITRSRQHRVALAFYWSVVIAIALSWVRRSLSSPPEAVGTDFLIASFLILSFAVLGLRGLFSLPIALRANWVLRLTQLRPTEQYIAATRSCLLLFGVAPIWVISAALSLHLKPWDQASRHLAFLALLGWVLVELSLIHFDKVPFTCSYLPGKTNIQVIFWGFTFVLLTFGVLLAIYEQGALTDASRYALLLSLSAVAIGTLWGVNRLHARSAALYFEEEPAEVVMRLGLIYIPPADFQSSNHPQSHAEEKRGRSLARSAD